VTNLRNKWLKTALGIAILAIVVTGCSVVGNAQTLPAVAEGKKLYSAECSSCHGEKGDRLPIAPLNSKEFLNSRGDATLMTVVSEGKGTMQAFSKERGGPWNADAIRSVLAYISSMSGRTSSSLLADEGRKAFQESCSRCHGAEGDRIPIAPLNARGFLEGRTDSELVKTISEGKGVMPAFSKELKDEQVRAVVSYLRYNVDMKVAGLAKAGRDLYMGNCLSCHGERGDRIPNISLSSVEYLEKLGDGALISSINDGKGVMPGFGRSKGGSFAPTDIAAILAYVKSWAGVNATSALAGPGVSGEGTDLFARNCAPCHGQNGENVAGVRLKSKEFLVAKTDPVIIQTISQGNAKGMPAWSKELGGPLSKEQIESIVKYLKSSAGSTAAAPETAAPKTGAPAAPSSGGALASSGGNPAAGKEIFMKNCTACHGETRDKVPTCKLHDKDFLKEKGDATLINSITNGKGPMPTWGKSKGGILSDEDIKNVVAFLKDAAGLKEGDTATATPPAASKDSGASGDAALAGKGKEVYTANCVGCHGPNRDLQANCKLHDKSWLAQKGDDGLFNAITKGKAGTIMPAWEGKISPDDIKAIVAYLKQAASGVASADPTGGSAPGAMTNVALVQEKAFPDVPLSGPAVEGKEIFQSTCAMCHGKDGLRIQQCPIGRKSWIQGNSPEGLFSRISQGKPNRGMPTWNKELGGTLAPDQIRAVMAYLGEVAQ